MIIATAIAENLTLLGADRQFGTLLRPEIRLVEQFLIIESPQ